MEKGFIMQRKESKLSKILLDELMADETFRRIRSCIQCGECTASCPSGVYSPLRVRKIMRKLLIGIDTVLSDLDIWECATCYNCYERCTRHIPVTEVIYKLRNMATRQGYLLEPMKIVVKNLVETGNAVPIGASDSKWVQLRIAHEMDPLSPMCNSNHKAMREIAEILDNIQFDRRINYRHSLSEEQ
jgi:heterodisulfide reductase subunit C